MTTSFGREQSGILALIDTAADMLLTAVSPRYRRNGKYIAAFHKAAREEFDREAWRLRRTTPLVGTDGQPLLIGITWPGRPPPMPILEHFARTRYELETRPALTRQLAEEGLIDDPTPADRKRHRKRLETDRRIHNAIREQWGLRPVDWQPPYYRRLFDGEPAATKPATKPNAPFTHTLT